MKIKFIAPASDFASTKYTPSQRPLHHFCCKRARATLWQFDRLDTLRAPARPPNETASKIHTATRRRSYTPLHAWKVVALFYTKSALLGKRTQGLFRTLEDFEFRAKHTLVQHLHFFEKKSEKSKSNPKHITTRLKILPVLTREHYTSLLHWV
jgi:hypothetical protein